MPVTATFDLTIPLWGIVLSVFSGLGLFASLYISVVILKERFANMKTEIQGLKKEIQNQAEKNKEELDEIKAMVYELLTPMGRTNLNNKRTG